MERKLVKETPDVGNFVKGDVGKKFKLAKDNGSKSVVGKYG